MNNLEKAKHIGEVYLEYSRGGKDLCIKGTIIDLEMVSADDFKVRDKPKKPVDLSVLIKSGIDCEFGGDTEEYSGIGKLLRIKGELFYKSKTANPDIVYWCRCRPRMDHWHSWQGGECPLPEGIDYEVMHRDGTVWRPEQVQGHTWKYEVPFCDTDIIAFRVTGLAEGYCMPWEN